MRTWRSGSFERERLSGLFRAFAPAHAVESLDSIDLDQLWAQGKRLLLLDVDNTIVAWKQENFSPTVLDWIAHAKGLGFQICIISNTRRIARLGRIREMLGVETVRGRFKPSRAMFRIALIRFGRSRDQAIMIGDQMMTDILGANRAGIDAIWVRQMETKEFGPTKLNRFMERLLTSAIYKVLVIPESVAASKVEAEAGKVLTLTDQIVRFTVVGGTSFLIDFCLTYFFMKGLHASGEPFGVYLGRVLQDWQPSFFHDSTPDKDAASILGFVASLFAMFNSFIWNRIWTFEATKGNRSAQMARFYAVSIFGSFLNAGIFQLLYKALPGQQILASKVVAALIVAVWNFTGQRTFAFRTKRT
jgi:hypothetical protein